MCTYTTGSGDRKTLCRFQLLLRGELMNFGHLACADGNGSDCVVVHRLLHISDHGVSRLCDKLRRGGCVDGTLRAECPSRRLILIGILKLVVGGLVVDLRSSQSGLGRDIMQNVGQCGFH